MTKVKVVSISPSPGIFLNVHGRYTPGEEETNLKPSFELIWITWEREDLTDLLEWAGSKGPKVLEVIEEECIKIIEAS